MSKIINGVASEYDIPMKYENKKQTIVINNDFGNTIKREDKPLIWVSEEVFTLKRDKDKLQQENKQLKENNMSMQEEMARTWKKADLYKEVIEEVREYLDFIKFDKTDKYIPISEYDEYKHLLQILDKVKGE